jgi:NADH:ubiquinone oxidoreductase subunit 4 (subunit M)
MVIVIIYLGVYPAHVLQTSTRSMDNIRKNITEQKDTEPINIIKAGTYEQK